MRQEPWTSDAAKTPSTSVVTLLRILTVILTIVAVLGASALFWIVGWHSLLLLSAGAFAS
jgi:hypothetical protein